MSGDDPRVPRLDRQEQWHGALSNLAGLAVYLVVLGVINLVARSYPGSTWHGLVSFLNATVLVVVLLSLLTLLADLAATLAFPANLVVPPLRAFGCAATVWYVVQVLLEVDRLFGLDVFLPLAPLAPLLYAGLFVLVLVGDSVRIVTGERRSG
ncbi:MAG: hypothetical protein GXY82_03700 [Methanospirillum sp.]|nr:hypothetical protein [Methanospirillum sp.]